MAKIIEVFWDDAISYGNAWVNGGMEELAHNSSVGYLHAEDKEKICLAQSKSGEDVMNKFVIPRGCIVDIKELSSE